MCELFSTFQMKDTYLEQARIIEMSQMKVEFKENRPHRINSATHRNREFAKFSVKIILTHLSKIESH